MTKSRKLPARRSHDDGLPLPKPSKCDVSKSRSSQIAYDKVVLTIRFVNICKPSHKFSSKNPQNGRFQPNNMFENLSSTRLPTLADMPPPPSLTPLTIPPLPMMGGFPPMPAMQNMQPQVSSRTFDIPGGSANEHNLNYSGQFGNAQVSYSSSSFPRKVGLEPPLMPPIASLQQQAAPYQPHGEFPDVSIANQALPPNQATTSGPQNSRLHDAFAQQLNEDTYFSNPSGEQDHAAPEGRSNEAAALSRQSIDDHFSQAGAERKGRRKHRK
ncbi:hypothetical protein BAUCODRAFT_146872 [Baudoinia panamericana UAMH 10762]|uniref:Uncharacterized protein n=1 Tax=Baudoinia panamericana (strain UAMH 10762) TaxID=717646 RepID=M2MNQ4_BAUPA|nr:uncharacterized protein BAUCODRAFT_146872 [Baudoinia panamericana UAMH 10762]EMC98321.1 hypothetical protein BAUCODRAFT_146872 [Baudoinia panamericana UAMH 10762]